MFEPSSRCLDVAQARSQTSCCSGRLESHAALQLWSFSSSQDPLGCCDCFAVSLPVRSADFDQLCTSLNPENACATAAIRPSGSKCHAPEGHRSDLEGLSLCLICVLRTCEEVSMVDTEMWIVLWREAVTVAIRGFQPRHKTQLILHIPERRRTLAEQGYCSMEFSRTWCMLGHVSIPHSL